MADLKIQHQSSGESTITLTSHDLRRFVRWLVSEKEARKSLAAALKLDIDAIAKREEGA